MSTTNNGFPWDGGDRSFLASDIASAWKTTYSNGVEDAENDFIVTVPDPTQEKVKIGVGTCRINGRRWTMAISRTITVPGGSGAYTPGYYGGSICIKANELTKDFEIVVHYSTSGRHPDPEEDEILIAEFYYWRPMGAMSTDVVVRNVTQSNIIYPQHLNAETATELDGLLKGAGGFLAAAVPHTDYVPGSALVAEGITLNLNAGIVAGTGTCAAHFKIRSLHIVLFRIVVTNVTASADQVKITALPPGDAAALYRASVASVTMQTTAEAFLTATTEYANIYEKQVVKFCKGQRGTSLAVSDLAQGDIIEGFALYY